jgi:hypothetical protein
MHRVSIIASRLGIPQIQIGGKTAVGNDGNAFEGGFRLWRDRVKFKEDEPITMLTPE